MNDVIAPDNRTKIWVGYFPDEADFKAFIAETYSEDEGHFLSPFSRSQNEHWFDHDWIECVFYEEGVSDQFYGLGEGQKEKVIDILKVNDFGPLNVVIIYQEPESNKKFEQFKSPQSVTTGSHRLYYLGAFKPHDSFL